MKVLFNHVGYAPAATKRLLIEAPADTIWAQTCVVRLPAGDEVLRPQPEFVGSVAGWQRVGPWWELDVSEVRQPGRYALHWRLADGRQGQSEGFDVAADRFGPALISDLLFHVKSQRSSGVWDRADAKAPRWDDRAVRDVRGGWFDASGDNSKYLSHLSYANVMNPQQNPLVAWVLARSWQRYAAKGGTEYFVERLRDEAQHGADGLMRMQDAAGFWYVTVFDRWSKDPAQRELCTYSTQAGVKHADYQAGWRQGGGMAIAALAAAARLGQGGDFSTADYARAAQVGFKHLCEHGLAYLDDGTENLIDDTCALLAAAELGQIEPAEGLVRSELTRRVHNLLNRRRETDGHVWLALDAAGARSWFHASDAGLPCIALSRAAELYPEAPWSAEALKLVEDWLASLVRLTHAVNNPFGYPPHWVKVPGAAGRRQWFYPHDNPSGYWWQGENATLASLAAAAWTQKDPPHAAAHAWMDWIFGKNPFDVCMMQGRGRNNPDYEYGFFNGPGGVCNGVTSGFEDEDDIAFQPRPWNDRSDQRWRWGEQWLPHAAWLLYALALRDTA